MASVVLHDVAKRYGDNPPVITGINLEIQEREFMRLGGMETIKVDVRIIAATNCDLKQMMEAGRFREDLYYRLQVFEIVLPPLRERTDDVLAIAEHFITRFNRKLGKRVQGLTPEAAAFLKSYDFPGNVRELRNMIERLVIMVPSDTIDITDLPAEFFRAAADIIATAMRLATLQDFKDEAEKAFILAKLRENGWNVSKTAEAIDTPRSNLYKKIEQYNIKREGGGTMAAADGADGEKQG